ncbi:DinB family protein [Paenibacillus radicis (ex Xue et al. 2023)]|uniref:DinB family protein n=1 Tax=Paenibacillus radicis (ex Xue et al. 2023) TaxID=2972489 RepID=A0ABT1YLS4_9BACL|nr:DinB family protein [Paenibacillus radicis (ex Xue et al. 2023)]MCR8633680.1 DinB family protein [Paenibacillus radicis (ex Xue et al. 2023)]
MRENKLFVQFRELRSQTISFAESVHPDIVDIVPEGFKNSIRWNLGHILVAWDHGIFPKINESRRIPMQYHRMFPKGSRPDDWEEKPPSFQEIMDRMRLQVDEIIKASEGKMDDLISKPFLRVKYLRGMFKFHITEEQHHLDCMVRIKEAIGVVGVPAQN